MIRIIPLLLACELAFSQTTAGADRTLLAEGDYVLQTKSGSKPQSHWKLWRLSNGEYEVVDSSAKNASAVQIFRFDPQFLPIGYTKKWGPPAVKLFNNSTIPGWAISCRYMERELRCDAESSDGRKTSASVGATPPYVLIGEFYDLDFPWFLTGVIRLASHSGIRDASINVYALTNGTNPGGIALKPDTPLKVVLVGEETEHVLGKTQLVRKYKWRSNDNSLLQVTAQGLVFNVSKETDPSFGFAIINYKEYEPWGGSFDSAPTGAQTGYPP